MNKLSLAKGVFAVGLAAACTCVIAGCSGASGSNDVKLTGGVAATVNGVEIPEDTITLAVESVRENQGLTDETAWGEWLSTNSYTPESVREEVLDSYINKEVLFQKAGDLGVTADESKIEETVSSMKGNYDSDEKWQAALDKAGITEDEYRENIKYSLLYEDVIAALNVDTTVSDEDILSYAQMYSSYYDGAKKSSHILFDAGDEATAQSVLDQINAGTLDFATAAEQYSKDTGSAADGGNVGWDKLSSFVTEYTDGLAGLAEGQVSGLVTSTYGIHIIKCTQVFTAPEELTSVDQLPAEFAESVTSMAQQSVAQTAKATAYKDWLTQCRDEADIVINDMPSGVPYNVDMTKYQTEDSSSAAATSDGSSSDSSTADESSSDSSQAEGDAGASGSDTADNGGDSSSSSSAS